MRVSHAMSRARVLLVAIAACGGAATNPAAPIANTGSGSAALPPPVSPTKLLTVDEILARYEIWTKQICTCTDDACATRVLGEHAKELEQLERSALHLDPRDRERMLAGQSATMEEYGHCAMRLLHRPPPPNPVTP
jgi:hypothetical protein